ncbi:MAG: YncE family protein, partial [Polyangiales bacterium]
MRTARVTSLLVAMLGIACVVGCGSDDDPPLAPQPGDDAGDGGPQITTEDFVRALPASCAFDCAKGCPDEQTGPFLCPSMNGWASLPHEDACGTSEPTLPAPTTGACAASEPTGEALRKAGPVAGSPGRWVLPDGHRLSPAGNEVVLADATHVGGFPVAMAVVPGSRRAITIDAGFGDHVARCIDLDALAAGKPDAAILSTVKLPRANWGVVVRPGALAGTHRVYVSGGDAGKVHVLDLVDATGVLALVDAKTIDLGTITDSDGKSARFFSAGLAVTPDGKKLVATSVTTADARIFSLDDATYGKELARPGLGRSEQFGVAIDPADTTGEIAWITLWSDARVVGVDLASGTVKTSIATAKNPEGMAFLDARWLVVADADGEALTLVDRIAGTAAATVPVAKAGADGITRNGWSPTALAYDAAAHRLYVAEAVVNAVEVFDVSIPAAPSSDAPLLTSRGRSPSSWWPTDLALDGPDGARSLLVLNGRGHGTGSGTGGKFDPGEGEIAEVMRGSLQSIDLGTLDLAAAGKLVDENVALGSTPGYPTVTCKDGAPYDFPVPRTNTEGPSTRI